MGICKWTKHTDYITKKIILQQIQTENKAIINEFLRYNFEVAELVRLNRVRNHFKVLYISDITEANGKRIKTSIFNRLKQIWMEKRKT